MSDLPGKVYTKRRFNYILKVAVDKNLYIILKDLAAKEADNNMSYMIRKLLREALKARGIEV